MQFGFLETNRYGKFYKKTVIVALIAQTVKLYYAIGLRAKLNLIQLQ